MTKEIELAAEEGANAYISKLTGICVDDFLAYKEGFLDCAQWMATRGRWVSVSQVEKLYNQEDIRLIATRFAKASRDKQDVTSNDTITHFDDWFKDSPFNKQSELPSPPQSKNTKEHEMKSNMENKIESDTDVVYVADEKGNVLFIRTFDLKNGGEPERQKAIATYTAVNEQFGYGCLTSIQRFKIQIEKLNTQH